MESNFYFSFFGDESEPNYGYVQTAHNIHKLSSRLSSWKNEKCQGLAAVVHLLQNNHNTILNILQ